MNEIFNHLWQSTLFGTAVALTCMALRRNSPRLRYWLWLAASVKFLIPFSLAVSIGARIQFPPDTPALHAVTVQQISTYFAPVPVFPVATPVRPTLRWPVVLGAIWLAGSIFLLFRWLRRWRIIHEAARSATRLPFRYAVPAFASAATMEPGVFGIFRPVILLPHGIADNLTSAQLEAILAHELRHISCHDNLTAVFHMCVETLFWFHPMVWWIGAKLMDERERDCDEAVLRQGSRPADYARGIVWVCETYIESPLPCAAGVSGSDLKKRIREIMTWRGSLPLTRTAKAMLFAACVAGVLVPFAIGVLRAQTLPPPPVYSYDAASIHKSDPGQRNVHMGEGPQGGVRTVNTAVLILISAAYKVQTYQIIGAPGWVSSEHFDVTFTPDTAEALGDPSKSLKEWQSSWSRNMQRLQAVLRDRFRLVLRAETRELPIYGLAQSKSGAKLSPHMDGRNRPSIQTNGDRQITATDATMEMLAEQLSMMLGRPVHDETGLQGRFDLKLDWTPDLDSPAGQSLQSPISPAAGPSIFTALTEQLGLRLQSKKGPVQVYVVEKIERPTEN